MKLIENKSIFHASTKIIKLKKEEVPSRAQQLLNHYQEGGIIVIEAFRPDKVNYSALNHCSQKACSYSWGNRSIKKMETKSLLKVANVSKELEMEMVTSEINICQSIYKIFSSMLSAAGLNDVEMAAKSIWRCLPTIDENYHVDVYPATTLRAYWNLDNVPRVWGFGHSSLDVLQMFPEDADLRSFLHSSGGSKEGFQTELNVRLNKLSDQLDYHILEFDPFDLWIADGAKGFHKIIYGKKMLSLNLGPTHSSFNEKFYSAFGYEKWIQSRIT